MSLHMSETEKINKRREEQKEKTWHVWQGRSGKEAAFIGKVMKTRKKAMLPSVFPFWSGAGKNSHTLLDRTVKAMESVYSPWRKKASNAWETAVKLNVRILPTQLPGCSALTGVIHIFILSSWLRFPLQQSEEHRPPTAGALLETSVGIVYGIWNFSFTNHD